MDFSGQLDDLQQRAAEAKTSAQAAVSESRAQLRRRIDQAKAEVDDKATQTRQDAGEVAASAKSRSSVWPSFPPGTGGPSRS